MEAAMSLVTNLHLIKLKKKDPAVRYPFSHRLIETCSRLFDVDLPSLHPLGVLPVSFVRHDLAYLPDSRCGSDLANDLREARSASHTARLEKENTTALGAGRDLCKVRSRPSKPKQLPVLDSDQKQNKVRTSSCAA